MRKAEQDCNKPQAQLIITKSGRCVGETGCELLLRFVSMTTYVPDNGHIQRVIFVIRCLVIHKSERQVDSKEAL